MKTFIKDNTWQDRAYHDLGWGNGYVIIPEGNPLHRMDYAMIDVEVHGCLTFSALVDEELATSWGIPAECIGGWMVGFDTAHCNDTLERWPKEAVQKETDLLLTRLTELAAKE